MSYTAALRRPIVIATLVLSIVAGLFAAWWLFPLGVVCAAIMAAALARDPAQRVKESARSPVTLAPRFQAPFDRVQRAQLGMLKILSDADARSSQALETVQPAFEALIDQVYGSCQRMSSLDTLRAQTGTRLTKELAQTERRLASTKDSLQRQAYAQTRQSLQSGLQQVEAVAVQLERFDAALDNLATEVEADQTNLIRLQARGAEQVRAYAPALANQTRERSENLRQFEQEVADLAHFGV